MKSAAANDGLSDPKHSVRATRTAGRQMLSRLLDAASRLFKEQGLAAVSIADIATAANAFPSQITYYFRTKEALFVEALKASFAPDGIGDWNRATFAHDLAVTLAGSPHVNEARTHRFQFLLRAATSPTTAPLLNVLVQDRFMGPIRDWLGGPDADARARVLAASYIGFLVERLIRGEALAGREREVFIDRVTAMFAALVTEST